MSETSETRHGDAMRDDDDDASERATRAALADACERATREMADACARAGEDARRARASGAKLRDAMERRVTKLAEERACIRENVAAVMRKANELFAEDE